MSPPRGRSRPDRARARGPNIPGASVASFGFASFCSSASSRARRRSPNVTRLSRRFSDDVIQRSYRGYDAILIERVLSKAARTRRARMQRSRAAGRARCHARGGTRGRTRASTVRALDSRSARALRPRSRFFVADTGIRATRLRGGIGCGYSGSHAESEAGGNPRRLTFRPSPNPRSRRDGDGAGDSIWRSRSPRYRPSQ